MRDGLHLRKRGRPEQDLRLPLRAHDPAAADRARADEEAACHRAHGFADRLRLEEGPPLQSVPRQAARREDRLRIPAPGAEEGGKSRSARGEAYTSRFRTPSAFDSIKARRGSTSSPISLVKISSAAMPSSICTFSSRRMAGSMVVSQSCEGFISPKPLYRCRGIDFSTSPSSH